jgi:hypothetical protein
MPEFMKVSCLKKLRHEDVGMVVNMIKTNQFEIKTRDTFIIEDTSCVHNLITVRNCSSTGIIMIFF